MPGKVILVDDQPEVLGLLADLMRDHGKASQKFSNGEHALLALKNAREKYDLVVLDLDLGPGNKNGMDILAEMKKKYPDLPVVILTGKGTIQDAVRAMRLGATDFIEKDPRLGERIDLQMEKLTRMLGVLSDNRRLKQQNEVLRQKVGLPVEMVGVDGGLRKVADKIRLLADIPRPVLILGERGTGKELVAQALHEASSRRKGPFVTVNCAALPETLAEAELFGHEKGAFTDARDARAGKFELADGGTLFLDEVGNMPLPIQQKILRTIEYQKFERVRGDRSIEVDVRVTAATNADMDAEMKAGRFRRDLYDRLAFETIEVPPLRHRREDIPFLVRTFIERFRKEVAGIACQDISDEALAVLAKLPFPGNVRELKNLIERAAYRCSGPVIGPNDLDVRTAANEVDASATGSLREQVRSFERRLLERALKLAGTNMAAAARDLGLGYDQMRRLVKKHRIGKD
jgi:DNA-binding NtrC family response regulator